MRIVHVTPFYYPVVGGLEEVVRKVAEYMVSKKVEVYVVTFNRLRTGKPGALPPEENVNGVHVIRLKPDIVWSHGTYSSEFLRVLRKLQPDIVHVHAWRHPHVFQVTKLKRRLKFKIILQMHGPFQTYQQLGIAVWLYHKLIDLSPYAQQTLEYYDKLIALTPFEKYIITSMLRVSEEKISVIPNFLDDDLFQRAYQSVNSRGKLVSHFDEPIALYVGRVSRDRNVELLLEVAKYLCKKVPKLKVLVVGPADSSIIKSLRSIQNVKYLGPVYDLEKKAYIYSTSTVFVNPTLYEAFGVALLEAEAFGLPCIITGLGGQLYAAPPGFSSIRVEPSISCFAEAVIKIISDDQLYYKLSRGAYLWAKRHLASRILPLYEKLYNELT